MKIIGYRQQTLTSPKWKWQNIHLLLYVLLGVLTSCETEESFYQSPLPQNKATSTRQAFFEPKSFFAYTDSTLSNYTRTHIIVQEFHDEQRDRSTLCAISVFEEECGVDKTEKEQYLNSQRLRATTSLAEYINQQGYITTSDLDFFNAYLSNNVVSSFRNEGYENYPFKEHPDITKVFPNIKLTAKNCNE